MDLARNRGVAISLTEPLPAAPQGVMHYAPGPVTYRQFMRDGMPWLVAYQAKHDGIGWLVTEAICRPLVMLPGDHIHLRAEFLEDQGPQVVVALYRNGDRQERTVDCGQVVFLEERGLEDGGSTVGTEAGKLK